MASFWGTQTFHTCLLKTGSEVTVFRRPFLFYLKWIRIHSF